MMGHRFLIAAVVVLALQPVAAFDVPPLELKMAWSPLLHNNAPHRWVRQFITRIARSLSTEPNAKS